MSRGIRIGFDSKNLQTSPGRYGVLASPLTVLTNSGGGGSVPGQVQNLLMDLQGQSSVNSTTSAPAPNLPNQQKIKWDATATATGYNIYRSTNGGSYSLYDTATTNSYTDTAATLCVNGTAGSGPDYYTPNCYRYKVSATNSSGEGTQSATQSCIYYQNGVLDHAGGDFDLNLTSAYQDTSNPYPGHTYSCKHTSTGGFGSWIVWAGNYATQWNLPLFAYNYLKMDIYMTSANTLQMVPIRVGDVAIKNSGGSQVTLQSTSYATLTTNTWVTMTVPLVDLMTDYTSGTATQLSTWYKCGFQLNSGSTGLVWYVDNVMFVP